MGLVALTIRFTVGAPAMYGPALVLLYLILWQDHVIPATGFKSAFKEASGIRGLDLASNLLLRFNAVRDKLRRDAESELRAEVGLQVEPEIRTIVGDSAVASMSICYAGLYLQGLNLRIYPVLQRYSAYTPLLDATNASWIRDQGPPFLIFDGQAIDGRDPWAETPAMWLEVYRWYDTRLLGSRNLLLQRRAAPRFNRLEVVQQSTTSPATGFRLPTSETPVFWLMKCPLSGKGITRKLLLGIPEIDLVTAGLSRDRRVRRALMAVLDAPVMGNFLPSSLAEFSTLFKDGALAEAVETVRFEAGISSYSDRCGLELLSPVRD
jgi:hypothetical protein